MNKVVTIEGMMCEKCVAHVAEALKALGAEVKVSLEEGKAYLNDTGLTDQQIKEAVTEAGYNVVAIEYERYTDKNE